MTDFLLPHRSRAESETSPLKQAAGKGSFSRNKSFRWVLFGITFLFCWVRRIFPRRDVMEEPGKSQQLCHIFLVTEEWMVMLKLKKQKQFCPAELNILLCNDAGHAGQPLEDKAGLEKKSCTSLQRSWKVPPGAGAKSCSRYPPEKEPGCENRPCPAPRMASG